MAVKKGDLVRVVRDKLEGSLEAQASTSLIPKVKLSMFGAIMSW